MKQFYTVLISSIIFFFLNFNLIAQQKVKEIPLKNIQGAAIGNDNESIGQVLQRAINEAKVEALKQAGIEENIASFTDYFQSENNDTYEELFASNILSDICGAVKQVEVIDTEKVFDKYGQLNVKVRINCIVVKYLSNKDLSFDVFIDGVGMFYPNETKLIFRLTPTKNAYANMFIFNETEAYQMFPSAYENSFLLETKTEYNFPTESVNYILYTDKKSEAYRMITKEVNLI